MMEINMRNVFMFLVGIIFIPIFMPANLALANTPAQFKFVGLPYDEAHDFYLKFRNSVLQNDKDEVSKLLAYPFSTKVKGKVVTFKNENEFLNCYDFVITNKVKKSLMQTLFKDLVLQPTGAMTKGGIVWIGGVRLHTKNGYVNAIRVIGINN